MFASPHVRLTLVAVSPLLVLALGCGSDRTRTTTVATGASVDTASPSMTTSAATPTKAPNVVSYESAEAAYSAGRYPEAMDLFTAYTERKPENPWGFYMLGLASWKAGNLGQAEGAFDQALKLDPKHQKSLLNSARVLIELGQTEDALERVQGALEIDSASAEAWRVLGRAQVELGDCDEAIEAYRHAITLDDRDAWAMNNLGLVYIQQGRYTDALPPLARATQLKPGAPVFQNNLGQALERSGYPAAAEAAYQAALMADSTYQKAALALERVAGRGEDSSAAQIDLTTLARDFQASVEQWRDEFARGGTDDQDHAAADSTMTRGMARDSTSDVVSRSDSTR